MYGLVIGFCIIAAAYGQTPGRGNCPEPVSLPNFDPERFSGLWYVHKKSRNLWETGFRCPKYTWTRISNDKMKIEYNATELIFRKRVSFNGNVTIDDNKISVVYYEPKINAFNTTIRILDTDYDNYAIVWTCSPGGFIFGHYEYSWIYTREENPSNDYSKQAENAFTRAQLPALEMKPTNFEHC